MKTCFNLRSYLDQPVYVFDILSMLSELEDFIRCSEASIKAQKLREMGRAEQRAGHGVSSEDEASDYFEEIDAIRYQFDVLLPQRIRYAALTALITTVDWVSVWIKTEASFEFPSKPKGRNQTIHVLTELNKRTSLDLTQEIQFLEKLVRIRNCIVHSAGLLTSYEHKDEICRYLDEIHGLTCSDINKLDERSIEIGSGFIEEVISQIRLWLPRSVGALAQRGLLRKSWPPHSDSKYQSQT
ncbi:MAG: hypothetical protein V5B30_02725 [Candidatus Accumulibacter delftensis]|jgi:hypothetical protein